MTKLEILYSIIECSIWSLRLAKNSREVGSEAEQGCSSASGRCSALPL